MNETIQTVPDVKATHAGYNPVRLLGMRIDRVTMEESLALIEQYIAEGKPRHIVTADASMVMTYREDPEFAAIIEAADLITPDGAGILWATRRLGTPVTAKVSGVDLSDRCCAQSSTKGWRIFFFGAAPHVAEEAAGRILARHPGAQIVGFRDGYFKPEDEPAIVEQIRAAKPDILLVALGIPKQEKFIARHREALNVPVMIGVGGTLDVFSGAVRRAPVWMQQVGLEWFYRVASNPNPRRFGKLKQLPRFARLVLSERK
ncbi:MAG: WecB/TagA/CpsF family glycosyltransferase [Armatimonadaceae bacterium]